MEIKRDAYLKQLIERKDNGTDADHIIEIALDGIENEELRDPKVCFAYDMTSEEKQTQELNSLRNIPDSFKKIVNKKPRLLLHELSGSRGSFDYSIFSPNVLIFHLRFRHVPALTRRRLRHIQFLSVQLPVNRRWLRQKSYQGQK